MLGWYQVIITILHKWIKTINTQTEGYGCHTCQYIHHYTPLTSWLYLSGKLIMPRESRRWAVKCLRNLFVIGWVGNEQKMNFNREWTGNIINLLHIQPKVPVDKWMNESLYWADERQKNRNQEMFTCCIFSRKSLLYCPNEPLHFF